MSHIIEVENLKKSYGKLEAVKGISFYVEKGKLFAFLGPNGAGKSTTIDMICTFLKADSGTVMVNGFPLGKRDEEIRHSIGVVFQDSLLDRLLTVEENMRCRGALYGLYGDALTEAAEADYVIVIDNGKVAAQGTPSNLRERYAGDKLKLSCKEFDFVKTVLEDRGFESSVTTTMGAFGIMVNDKVQKISKDFYSSPIRKRSIAGEYVLSAFVIGFIMSLVTLVLAEIYIVAEGGELLKAEDLLKVVCIIVLTDIANTAMIFFITTFFESNNAFSTASTVIGVLIGFITGIYLPIGQLPEGVQWVIKLFPTSHVAGLMR